MAIAVRSEALDFAATVPSDARGVIKALLEDEPKATRKVYAALARKVWSLLVERRFDDEIRDWHELLNSVKAYIRSSDAAASERLAALADLLRESIGLAQTSPAREVANRPRARQILDRLNASNRFVPRLEIRDKLGIGNSNLSNVLTQLLAHDLVDRRDRGKEAEFRITVLGRQLIGGDGVRADEMVESLLQGSASLGPLAIGIDDRSEYRVYAASGQMIVPTSIDPPGDGMSDFMPFLPVPGGGVVLGDESRFDQQYTPGRTIWTWHTKQSMVPEIGQAGRSAPASNRSMWFY